MRDGGLPADLGRSRPAGLPRPGRLHDAGDDALGGRRVGVEELLELGPEGGRDGPARLGVVELLLGLALELRVDEVQVHDGDEALADVLGRDV